MVFNTVYPFTKNMNIYNNIRYSLYFPIEAKCPVSHVVSGNSYHFSRLDNLSVEMEFSCKDVFKLLEQIASFSVSETWEAIER